MIWKGSFIRSPDSGAKMYARCVYTSFLRRCIIRRHLPKAKIKIYLHVLTFDTEMTIQIIFYNV